MNWREDLKEIRTELDNSNITDAAALEAFRIRFLGSKNIFKPVFEQMKQVPAEEKKEFGQKINELKNRAEEVFQLAASAHTVGKATEIPDLSLPATPGTIGSRHPISLVMDKIVGIFEKLVFR